ncbi:MAG TPA: NUDIX domain-containing protein [Verrucomicrobiae bacterium]|nr:NUDIX domain-containing protein [Verrucomicrobiae bacterium]
MSEKLKWKKEFGAGGIVFKKQNGRFFVLMIKPKGPNYGPPVGYWTWPKGLLDKEGEDKPTVAIREVREEGGVNAEIVTDLGEIKFFRKSEAFGNAIKFVHYYLMRYIDGDTNDHDEEVAEASWVPLEEAKAKLKFPHDKELFTKAEGMLNNGIAS